MLRKAYVALKTLGPRSVLTAVRQRILPERLRCYAECRPSLEARVGLEIGGPSTIFTRRGCLPVYPVAARIDNCNFDSRTVWEGTVTEGDTFVFDPGKAPGRQYVAEASELGRIGDSAYDFVLSSHCIEHLANPLQGLGEWIRVLKDDGLLVLIVPHKDGTFDHRRPVTSLTHIVQDFEARTTERDLTHLDEILKLHDLARDPEAGGPAAFAERSKRNFENRCLHHHVFDTRLAVALVDHARLQILAVEAVRPYHIVVIAKKLRPGQAPDNERFTGTNRAPCWSSPFASDRTAGPLTGTG
jgi:SAM-dependent methyltransferase